MDDKKNIEEDKRMIEKIALTLLGITYPLYPTLNLMSTSIK